MAPQDSAKKTEQLIDIEGLFSHPEPEVLFFQHTSRPTEQYLIEYPKLMKQKLLSNRYKYYIVDTRKIALPSAKHRERIRKAQFVFENLYQLILISNDSLFPISVKFTLEESFPFELHFAHSKKEALRIIQAHKATRKKNQE